MLVLAMVSQIHAALLASTNAPLAQPISGTWQDSEKGQHTFTPKDGHLMFVSMSTWSETSWVIELGDPDYKQPLYTRKSHRGFRMFETNIVHVNVGAKAKTVVLDIPLPIPCSNLATVGFGDMAEESYYTFASSAGQPVTGDGIFCVFALSPSKDDTMDITVNLSSHDADLVDSQWELQATCRDQICTFKDVRPGSVIAAKVRSGGYVQVKKHGGPDYGTTQPRPGLDFGIDRLYGTETTMPSGVRWVDYGTSYSWFPWWGIFIILFCIVAIVGSVVGGIMCCFCGVCTCCGCCSCWAEKGSDAAVEA